MGLEFQQWEEKGALVLDEWAEDLGDAPEMKWLMRKGTLMKGTQKESQKGVEQMSENGRRTGHGDHDITISGTLISKVMTIAVVVIFMCAVLLCALLGIAGVVGAVRLVQFLCAGMSLT